MSILSVWYHTGIIVMRYSGYQIKRSIYCEEAVGGNAFIVIFADDGAVVSGMPHIRDSVTFMNLSL